MRHLRLIIILTLIIGVLSAPILIFFFRSPVLVVTDAPFALLYGTSHLKQRQIFASLSLFRQVKPVLIADGVSADVVAVTITESFRQPCCVLFPRSQSAAAKRFHEQNPEIPLVLLSGLVQSSDLPAPDGYLCVYNTDREVDLYRAGLFAGIIGSKQQNSTEQPEEKDTKNEESAEESPKIIQNSYILWQDRFVKPSGRDIFIRGVMEEDPESHVIFVNSGSDVPDPQKISCAVLTAAGTEFLEKNHRMPMILFSWLDPSLASKELIVLFDDSIWAQAVPAVRLALEQQAEASIPSKALIFSGKIVDNSVSRELKKAAKKLP